MRLFRLVVLVVCFHTVHGQSADRTDSVTPGTRTILLAVSDLIQLNDLRTVSFLEAKVDSVQLKYENILEENCRLRERIEILEKRQRPDEHQVSTRAEQIHQEEGTRHSLRKLFIEGTHSSSNRTEHSDINNTTTDVHSKSVHEHNAIEYTTEDRSKLRTPGPTVRTDKAEGRRMMSEHPKRALSQRLGESTDVVAFSAYLSRDINEPANYNSIKFDHVVTNDANGYNPVTGEFTCPKAGVYVFTWSTAMHSIGSVYTHLIRNGMPVAFSFTADNDYYSMSSQTSVLVLSQGDVVAVVVDVHSASPTMWSLYTSFNGFILL